MLARKRPAASDFAAPRHPQGQPGDSRAGARLPAEGPRGACTPRVSRAAPGPSGDCTPRVSRAASPGAMLARKRPAASDFAASRYAADFWGLAGGRGKPGRRKRTAAADEGPQVECRDYSNCNQRNEDACKDLLISLATDDLRGRLTRSRYDLESARRSERLRQIEAGKALDDDWLGEAASAFNVPTRKRKQMQVVEDVLEAVRQTRQRAPGTATAMDADRREALRRRTWSSMAALHEAKVWGMRATQRDIQRPQGVDALRDELLVRSCPEDLRLRVVGECLQRRGGWPAEAADLGGDDLWARRYLHSAMARRYASASTGEQLLPGDVARWQQLLDRIPEAQRPTWQADPLRQQLQAHYEEHGHLNVRPSTRRADDPDRLLLEGLKVLRRARLEDVRGERGHLLRRQLSPGDMAAWETAVPANVLWGTVRQAEAYIPGSAILGSRCEWPREPVCCQPCPCYLCGQDFATKQLLQEHWREEHVNLPEAERGLLAPRRVEEEVRKRILADEQLEGPFEVRGAEQRRALGRFAENQTQSRPGGAWAGHFEDRQTAPTTCRALSGCVVCARSFWLEELFDADLFVEPVDPELAAGAGDPAADGAQGHGAEGVPADAPARHPRGHPEPPPAEDAAPPRRARFAVRPEAAAKVHALLSVERYAASSQMLDSRGRRFLPLLARVAQAARLETSRKVDLLRSAELPAPPPEAQRFLAESVVIALAGADVDDLSKARWANVRKGEYMGAASFLTSHSVSYNDMTCNQDRADAVMSDAGAVPEAVRSIAIPIEVSEQLKHRLEGPADACAGADEQVVRVDGEECVSEHEAEEEEGENDLNAALPDPDFPAEALPAMSFCADAATGGDLDELQAIRKVHGELEALQDSMREEASGIGYPRRRLIKQLQVSARGMLDRGLADRIHHHHKTVTALEETGQRAAAPGGAMEGYAQGTAAQPLSMYSPELWSMCFPDKFPYGDGVFGLSRTAPMSFHQCTSMHLLREELVYQVTPEDLAAAAACKAWVETAADGPGATGQSRPSGGSCACQQCREACRRYVAPEQPRWGADRDLICCYYDAGRRIEQIRRARGHVHRTGFQERLEKICAASTEKLDAAVQSLGPNASLKDAMRSPAVDQDVKDALSELMVFTSEVLGSDGARAKLRHEQNGFALMFGGAGGFLTPNVADVRSPILLALHAAGGCETHAVDLLAEAPDMPSARKMLQIVAQDPVAQARFFIFSMQLFCEHVLGTGPWDLHLRHNGRCDGAAFPDGFATSCTGGAFLMLAALHGPIEVQARLSIHPRILLWFVHAQSEQWLRCVLNRETEEIRQRLRVWQEKTLAAVQSMQLDSAAVLPLLLTDDPDRAPEPRNTPFSEKLQRDCRMDGELEHDVDEPEKRRVFLATEPPFEDHHLRRHRMSLAPEARPMSEYMVPQTGAQLCRLEHYRLLRPTTGDDLETAAGRSAEAAAWAARYAEDYRQDIAVGQMHQHKDTCFKYVVEKSMRFARHCRFNFCHFVKLWLRVGDGGDSSAQQKRPKKLVTLARTGKDLVLPRGPGEPEPDMFPLDEDGAPVPLRPGRKLGPVVNVDPDHGKQGLVMPIRWNPMEGSSNGVAQTALNSNVDFQSMMRTFMDGFDVQMRDELRDPPLSADDEASLEAEEDEKFEASFAANMEKLAAARKRANKPELEYEEAEMRLRQQRAARRAAYLRLGPAERFRRSIKALTVTIMKQSVQAMFYACDYSTKPNMTCAPLLVAVRDGIRRLEERLRTEVQDEARRRLIRQATAANQAIVKGNCLMVMQMLTRREVLRSHSTWQLMMKNAMWLAFESRRLRQGFDEREQLHEATVLLDAAEVDSQATDPDDCDSEPEERDESADGDAADEASDIPEAPRNHASPLGTRGESPAGPRRRRAAIAPAGSAARPAPPPASVAAELGSAASTQVAAAGGAPTDDAFAARGERGASLAEEATDEPQQRNAGVRLKSNSYYDDYLHRGSAEFGASGRAAKTPLASMSYYDYGMWVRVVPGDPNALAPDEYAFAGHYGKHADYVQQLRAAPAAPYISGFTMPTEEKDPETNACFKQVLLRPHACPGPDSCRQVHFAQHFCCASRSREGGRARGRAPLSFLGPWRAYRAEQLVLAKRADQALQRSRQCPVLHDTTAIRYWHLPGTARGGPVHESFLPLLCGGRHATDPGLDGTWCRRREIPTPVAGADLQRPSRGAVCWRMALPVDLAWAVLRFAGDVRGDDGRRLGVAGSEEERARLDERAAREGESIACACPGVHDDQLTPEMFFAVRHVEVAARLEYMAEARGLPKPARGPSDAVAEEELGGDRSDDDGAFGLDEALPGEDSSAEERQEVADAREDREGMRPRWRLAEEEFDDVVHRTAAAQAAKSSRVGAHKKALMETFLQLQRRAYACVRQPCAVPERAPRLAAMTPADVQTAKKNQDAIREQRAAQDDNLEAAGADLPVAAAAFSDAPAPSRRLGPEDVPISPLQAALTLIAESGVWKSKEQYLVTLFLLQPIQQLWQKALETDGLDSLSTAAGLAAASRDVQVRRVFLHGPGGSGKTYCMTEVVNKVVVRFFGHRGLKLVAAANSAARILGGKTMHAAAKLTRKQSLAASKLKPNTRAKKKLEAEWEYLVLLLADEIGLASPPLLAGLSRRATFGRKDLLRLCVARAIEEPFGQVPVQAIMGDFMQINPVCSHTLLEALLARARVPGVPRKITDEDEDGWKVFRKMASDVVVFTGTHRFLDEDLPLLFEVMRTPGGARVPDDLRAKIRDRVQRGPDDPRMSMDYELEGVRGFFALGARAAIQWEQVARLQQLHVLASARVCPGPRALLNGEDGRPDLRRHGFSAAHSGARGQLVYYFQAVDRFKHHQDRDMYLEALKFMNLSKSNGLPGMCAAYLGMRGRLTKKVMGPELVQEATGEVVGIRFHPRERFGFGENLGGDLDQVDYTGLGKRGVFHLEPVQDEWELPVARVQTVNRPGAPRAKQFVVKSKQKKGLQVARTQLSWAPEDQLTFQSIQGRTIRGPEGQPKGFVVDLFRPGTMQGEDRRGEYFQHVWMILGRARKLEWMLLQNFPLDESTGDLDWSILEQGPPDYLIEFLGAAATLSRRTSRRMLRAQKELGAPAWEDVPECPLDPDRQGRFLYIAEDWIRAGAACARPVASASAEARPDAAPRRRLRGKRPREELRSKTDRPTAPPDEPGGAPPRRKRSRGEGAGDEGERACAPPGAAPASSTQSTLPSAPSASAGGWHCSLLGRAIGRRRRAPAWFNNPLMGEVDPASGTQLGLTCGFFAVNHCLGHAGMPQLSAEEFRQGARDGLYPEGDFDDGGLRQNLAERGCHFDLLQGADHQDAILAVGDSDSCLAVFNGNHALGVILHQPCPRHWIALVRPPEAVRDGDAAWLCDSLHSAVFALEASEVQDLLGHVGSAQMGAADRAGSELDRMREISDWCAYRVHR
ncbi:unnamed protein product [Prorocentrum cordatum]|uniref:ATP-dependent DNA helicase n=1 Tax=Prorocentrum cordatum TaxID=2364126 RepID=A0ABN9QBP9_9DINO|nr:unnamed protein product [Polarella glacialis]